MIQKKLNGNQPSQKIAEIEAVPAETADRYSDADGTSSLNERIKLAMNTIIEMAEKVIAECDSEGAHENIAVVDLVCENMYDLISQIGTAILRSDISCNELHSCKAVVAEVESENP